MFTEKAATMIVVQFFGQSGDNGKQNHQNIPKSVKTKNTLLPNILAEV